MIVASNEISLLLQAAPKRKRTHTFRVASTVFLALLAASPNAIAECTDTFNTAFVPAGAPPGPQLGTPYQHAFPLGVGSSLNAVVSTMNTVNTAFLSPSSAFVSAKGGAEPGQLGGGVWFRTVAGVVETRSTTSGTIDVSKATTGTPGAQEPLKAIPGKGTCNGTLKEEYFGYQFGFDLASLNVGGSGGNLHFGFTAGYFDSRSNDTSSGLTTVKTFPGAAFPTTLVSPSGSFEAGTQVPFLGLYAVFTQGNFFADALVRHDFYVMDLSDPLNGLSGQGQNATGLSVGGNVGYKVPLPSNWFIEPSGGVIWSRVKVDSISTPGSATFQFLNSGSVDIDDIDSVLGRASLRIGTTITATNIVWQPFVTGSVFHEFAGEATATSRIAGPVDSKLSCTGFGLPGCPPGGFFVNSFRNQALETSTTRIGTFAQFGIGTAAAFGSSGWLGYVRADYRTGDNVEGYNVNAGLRYNW
jgi:hypothetical protein